MSEENKTNKSQGALREEAVLSFWKENKIFEKSLEKEAPKGKYVFFEGPPTANGKPGIHHLEARAFKDVIPRYKTMQGYYVRRKGGWDTHGLPVELQVEKELGLKSKKEIEEYGIAQFNKKCKESVWAYVDLWEKFTDRIGFWLDQKNAYVTYHNDYIESVWNVIKTVNDQKLLYKDYKVVPWCPRCGTALSSHEMAQGYEDIKDLSVIVKFKVLTSQEKKNSVASPSLRGLRHEENSSLPAASLYILAWTTTPWTLPGNVALAVGEKIDYVKIKKDNNLFILAKARLSIIDGEYEIVEEMKGKDLLGLEYEPLYPYFQNSISGKEKEKMDKAFKVYGADFVTTEDGTGVVHTAVMYGQDDFELGTKIGLPKHHLVGLDGKFLAGTDFLEGRFVRDEEVAVDIIKDLAHRGLLQKKEKYEHSYPHCWRCKTALIYYARDSWYIRMSSLRDKLVKENEGINWEPAYIKEGRFGEWLREIKDWAISRERYWGSPLPVWICDKCQKVEVVGGIDDLKSKTKKSGNKYFVMRHGESEANLKGQVSCHVEDIDHLTEQGKKEVLDSVQNFKDKKIDLIISSDFMRTKETAEIVRNVLNLDESNLIFDYRAREINVGSFDGSTWQEYYNSREEKDWYSYIPQNGGESCKEVKLRMTSFLHEIEEKYKDKNILIVSHEGPIRMLLAGIMGLNDTETEKLLENGIPNFKNAEIMKLDFVPFPCNEHYELDLHKPYIDEVELACACGGNLIRTKEVMDVWLDSGTMPFSQDHYPFNKEELQYPADFIAEAIDQTRGWFYTLHAVGVLMGKGKSYKNVICLGHLLDAKGKKMSKSLGNIVDPIEMIDKYGVDALRLWMYSVNQPGESKNFDEKTVAELNNKVFNLLYNVLAFYELYRDSQLEIGTYKQSKNVLDQWIVARLNKLVEDTTKQLDNYKLLEPVRALREFIDDLSTWYLRRSRDRIKDGDKEAKQTLYYVSKTLVKLMAPFTPFSSEDIWQKLKNENDKESVHLESWPTFDPANLELIEEMKQVREVVTLGLEARQKEGIKVRQPLNRIILKQYDFIFANKSEYIDILQEELNIKNIECSRDDKSEKIVILDTFITPELKKEGQYRELVRAIQDLRKKEGLIPSDVIALSIKAESSSQELIKQFEVELKKAVGAKEIKITDTEGAEVKIDELEFIIKIQK